MIRLTAIVLATALALPTAGLRADTVEAPLIGNDGTEIGKVELRGGTGPTVARITVQAGKVTPGWHGVHFHAVGDCSDHQKFQASKSHVNHGGRKHGLLNPEGPDDGDLPNVFAAADGSVNAEVSSPTPLAGLRDADGSALVMHANADDHTTQPIGGAGARVACAMIR
ncbi:MAG: superoxide dismutase family protein [Thalassobaculum sp.]|uniref:superoxide dismutase family protein n=1 Tax=Thalassobaculum sp. TaxID=2022740 RepID=UPI0032EF1A18